MPPALKNPRRHGKHCCMSLISALQNSEQASDHRRGSAAEQAGSGLKIQILTIMSIKDSSLLEDRNTEESSCKYMPAATPSRVLGSPQAEGALHSW